MLSFERRDSFMDINWQFNNPANPADAQIGPQAYDNHLYYSFGVSALSCLALRAPVTELQHRELPTPTRMPTSPASAVSGRRTFHHVD